VGQVLCDSLDPPDNGRVEVANVGGQAKWQRLTQQPSDPLRIPLRVDMFCDTGSGNR